MTVLTQQILSPRLSLISNNNNHIQVTRSLFQQRPRLTIHIFQNGKRLKRSWSTGSGDKIVSKNLPEIQDITDGFVSNKLMEVIPDLLSNLVITAQQTNNNVTEDKMLEKLDAELENQDDFQPGMLGLIENPGVISFDSLDYPDFGDDLSDSEDEVEMEENISSPDDYTKRILRFSFDDLVSMPGRQDSKFRMRTKSLSDINEILGPRQYSHREETKKIS